MAKGDGSEVIEKQTRVLTRDMVKSDTFASYYINDVQIESSVWDVRFKLGMVTEVDGAKNHMVVNYLADIRMSPQHAKKVAEILAAQIEKYEKRFGKLPNS